jgi:Positive regulator of sigma E activity
MVLITIFAPKLQCRVCNLVIMKKDYLQHQGIVDSIEKNKVFVRIEQKTACSDCHARSACLSSDRKEKVIEVDDDSGQFDLNEEVIVSVQSSMGLYAVVLSFVIPLVLVVLTLFICIKITGDEALSGLTGLLILVPYYFVLYVLRGKIKKHFVFSVSKVHSSVIESLNTATY